MFECLVRRRRFELLLYFTTLVEPSASHCILYAELLPSFCVSSLATVIFINEQERPSSFPISQWCILHILPYFPFFTFSSISTIFFNFPYFRSIYGFWINLRVLAYSYLTTMHLCIMLYTYWTPLQHAIALVYDRDYKECESSSPAQ